MPRPRKKALEKDAPFQIVFRVPATLHDSLVEAMGLLNVDMSNLLRMMITENIGQYIARGKRSADSLAEARALPKPPDSLAEAQALPNPPVDSGQHTRFLDLD